MPSTIGTPITRIAVASFAPDKIDTAASKRYTLVAPYPGNILAGKKLKGRNPSVAPAIIKDSWAAISVAGSAIENLRLKMPITIAEIATIPGICPSTPLLQLSIFITHTIHRMDMAKERNGKKVSR